MGAVTDSDSVSPPDAGELEHERSAPTRWEQAANAFERWRGGDRRAMDELVRIMTPVLWHVSRAYGLERALAEDVVQTTWTTLMTRHESIEDPRAVSGWLTTCARREAWRSARAHRRDIIAEPADLEPLGGESESTEEHTIRSERDRSLWRAVAALDERCRRLLRVVAFEDRPDYAQLSADLGMPIGSIGPTRGRCLAKLRSALTVGES